MSVHSRITGLKSRRGGNKALRYTTEDRTKVAVPAEVIKARKDARAKKRVQK